MDRRGNIVIELPGIEGIAIKIEFEQRLELKYEGVVMID